MRTGHTIGLSIVMQQPDFFPYVAESGATGGMLQWRFDGRPPLSHFRVVTIVAVIGASIGPAAFQSGIKIGFDAVEWAGMVCR